MSRVTSPSGFGCRWPQGAMPRMMGVFAWWLLCWTVGVAGAQDVDSAIEDAGIPWYDTEAEKIKSLSDFQRVYPLTEGTESGDRASVRVNFSDRLQAWLDAVRDFFDWLYSLLPDWLANSSALFWGILIVLVLALVALITYFLLKMDAVQILRRAGGASDAKRKRKAATVEDLPFELEGVSLSAGNLLDHAKQEMKAGNRRLAMVYLFSHLLLVMDQRELIRLQKGKTNRAYGSELKRNDRQSLPLYLAVMQAFERSFFGHHDVSEDEVAGLIQQTEGWG